ncbi:transcription termination factor 5, mitochondrial [Zootermopsis nevadensis]|uniref:transcription termination factor 5, mitochondrial n=1 Tax=Zootermopsis nevadensis TaxID=136037 RepID=UPI000B8E5510|nr:transcription termination factor 5, mitochondrial [Zootermopsis nevadensis]
MWNLNVNNTSTYFCLAMLSTRMFKICQHPFYIPSAIKLCNLSSGFHQIRRKPANEMNNGQVRLLMEVFDYPYRETYKIVYRHKVLRTLDQNLIQRVADILNRFGIEKGDIAEHPLVLTIFPATIENHTMLLEEGGFTHVTAKHLNSYITIVRKPLRLLKVHQYIPSHIDVPENFLSYLKEPPPSFDPLHSKGVSHDTSFMDIQMAVLSHYLCWRLEMKPDELDSLMKTYSRLKHKSFRLIEKSLKVLEEELGFSKEKIKRHGYLIHSHAGNTLDTLNRVKTLGGMDIRTMFHKYPKIIATATDTLIKTAQHLQDFGIPDEAIQKCPEVFTLGSDTVFQRLGALQSVPEFTGLARHPRVLRLVHHQRKACSRLGYLQDMKVKCASLHILSSTQVQFERSPGSSCWMARMLWGYIFKHLRNTVWALPMESPD